MEQRHDMTPEERWARAGELLYKGIYLLVRKDRSKQPGVLPSQSLKKEYTPQEAAKLLGVSHRTIQRWIQCGKILPKRKPNGYIVLPYSELKKCEVLKSLP